MNFEICPTCRERPTLPDASLCYECRAEVLDMIKPDTEAHADDRRDNISDHSAT